MQITKRIGFIGAGQMATALAKGFLTKAGVPVENMLASDAFEASRERFHSATGIEVTESNMDVMDSCDVILLAVKPQVLPDVMEEIAECVRKDHLIISICAGITLEKLEAGLGEETHLVRVMPNTPCLVGQGAIAFCQSETVTNEDFEITCALLKSVGRCFHVGEHVMDAVTGLSGSGPAYIYLVIEALSDAGVMMGLPRDVATTLAAQTVRGAADMVLETREHPGVLKDRVTSPAGTTIAGMRELEAHGVRAAMYEAVKAAAERSAELGRK
ncbi:MAG: pyrroline-5-carboxylate reductase [Thermoguttaceae bacterium]|nr:pyrroline-5-carboxylate reductase [Thermoguttaceae bacterium]